MSNGFSHEHVEFDWRHDPNWRIFRIMSEFVDGFDFIAQFERSVSVFGSARTAQDNPYFLHARELGNRLGSEGFAIITGGGPGIMEAANEGAKIAKADSVGLNIELPMEQRVNPYVTRGIAFRHFYTRKVMLSFASQAYVFFPGGFGTLDEMFEMVTLIQTQKIEGCEIPGKCIPIILFGSGYWNGLIEWIKKTVYEEFKAIDAADTALWTVTDSVEEAVELIKHSQPRRHLLPNNHEA